MVFKTFLVNFTYRHCIMKDKELEDRLAFIEVYRDFNSLLHCLGFKTGKGGTYLDYNYSHYDEYIEKH